MIICALEMHRGATLPPEVGEGDENGEREPAGEGPSGVLLTCHVS